MPGHPRSILASLSWVLRVGIGGTLGVLLTKAPPLREALIASEPLVAPGLFLIALAGAGRWWILRGLGQRQALRRARYEEALLGRGLMRWGWVPTLVVFVLPIWSHWDQRPPDPLVEFSALLGHIPWGDAHGHFEGGLRLLGDDRFGAYSERRPMHAAWLAARLWLTGGDLGAALLLQALVLGLASFLLARSVGRRYGPWAGIAVVGLLQGFARGAVPCVVTEPLGMTLAIAATTVLISSGAQSRLGLMALGVFLLDAALAARPGPQFLGPAVALWAVIWSRPRWKRTALVLAVMLLLNGVLTRTLNGLYGAGEADFSTYPAYTLYGLTHGSNYRQVRADLGEDLSRYGSERDLASLLYRRSFQRLRERPQDLVVTLVRNEAKFFGKLPYNLSQLLTLRHFLFSGRAAAEETVGHERLDLATALPLLALALLGSGVVLRKASSRERWFWLSIALAVVASVPFVYGDAGFRGLASAYPLAALLLGMGLATSKALTSAATTRPRETETTWSAALAVLILGLSLILPGLVRGTWPRPTPTTIAGLQPGETIVFAKATAPKVLVARFPRQGLASTPFVERDRAAQLVRLSQATLGATLFERPGAFVILSVFDFVSRRQRIVVADAGILRVDTEFIRASGHPASGGDLFEVQSYEPLP